MQVGSSDSAYPSCIIPLAKDWSEERLHKTRLVNVLFSYSYVFHVTTCLPVCRHRFMTQIFTAAGISIHARTGSLTCVVNNPACWWVRICAKNG
jgi:hypothetical protein